MPKLQSERRWVFTWLDLVAPWGVGLLVAGLCLWGVISGRPADGGNPYIPKIILGVVGLSFLATIPGWYFARSTVRRFDFKVSPMGLYVRIGKVNRPTASQVQIWVDELRVHWTNTVFLSKGGPRKFTMKEVENSLAGMELIYVDAYKMSVFGRWVSGFNTSTDAVIGLGKGEVMNAARAESLTKHELSHFILGNNKEGWDEDQHHAIFKYTKLGA